MKHWTGRSVLAGPAMERSSSASGGRNVRMSLKGNQGWEDWWNVSPERRGSPRSASSETGAYVDLTLCTGPTVCPVPELWRPEPDRDGRGGALVRRSCRAR